VRDVMTSLGGWIRRRLRGDDRGAIALIVAILIAMGVLTGILALVVDVGQVYQERAELQSGADAAAIGVAKTCALGTCDPTVATQLASANASALTGNTEGVSLVCGSAGMTVCPPSTGAPTDCPPPPAGATYVDVYTSTETAGGSTLLPPVFARALLGNSGYAGTNVKACAQAEWGNPVSATTIALTISACEWDQATQQGAQFPANPPYPPSPVPASSSDQVLVLNAAVGTGCATEPGGADGPGTFGWVAPQGNSCTVPINAGFFAGDARTDISFSCQQVLQNAQRNQAPIVVPVYVSQSAGSGGPTYTLKGFASFVVTGYNMPDSDGDGLSPANNCPVTETCLNGYFVHGVVPFTGTLGTTNLGVSVINLTG
jgi:Flp pilus assembly protein TadG